MTRTAALAALLALPAAAQEGEAPPPAEADAAARLAPAAVTVRLEGVRIEIDAAEIELLLGPEDLARALRALGVGTAPEAPPAEE